MYSRVTRKGFLQNIPYRQEFCLGMTQLIKQSLHITSISFSMVAALDLIHVSQVIEWKATATLVPSCCCCERDDDVAFVDDVKLSMLAVSWLASAAMTSSLALPEHRPINGQNWSKSLQMTHWIKSIFTRKLGGLKPTHSANRPPTPDISPKWVNRLFFVILWPVEVVSRKSSKLLPPDVTF